MARRLLSHLLITLAVFSMTATFFIWVIDAALLNADQLNKALRDGGVSSALASAIPDIATRDNKEISESEKADMKAKIAAIVTPAYIDQKLQLISGTVIRYMKNGSLQPTIDISDFPAKLRATGVDVGEDIDKTFKDPINLNKSGALNVLPDYYSKFQLAKYVGTALFVVFLVAEWFVAAKGEKLKRIGRIFLHAGVWYMLWWLAISVVPARLLPKVKDSVNDTSVNALIDAVVRSIQHLFSTYFLSFAIFCAVLAIALYLARHVKHHVGKIQAVPHPEKAPIKQAAPVKSTSSK